MRNKKELKIHNFVEKKKGISSTGGVMRNKKEFGINNFGLKKREFSALVVY